MPKTMFAYHEGGLATCVSTNKDANSVVIGGRNVFKLYSIEEEEFVEKYNLRVGKNMNLNFSISDVAWNPIDDNILATSATNGSVVTYNLGKSSHSKQDKVFQHHKRTTNKVTFHPTDPSLLSSGSQDGTVKIFDLRKSDVINTFNSNSESVRDVQFNPFYYHQFAAVQDNGIVQVWDMRKADKPERFFTAHGGPIFCCDWHPEEKRWLATGGRDKTIKVWNLNGKSSQELIGTIHAISAVARLKWRPHRKYQFACIGMVLDPTVSIYDIRRPYIPFAALNHHKDTATGICWRNSPHVILSTCKDGTLCQHIFKDADRPIEHIIPMGLDMSIRGDIILAASDQIIGENWASSGASGSGNNNTRQMNAGSKLQGFFRKQPNLGEQFATALSICVALQNKNDKNLSMDWFVESAKRYRLTGQPLAELCDYNAAVANELNRQFVAQSWNILKLLYGSEEDIKPVPETKPLELKTILKLTVDAKSINLNADNVSVENASSLHLNASDGETKREANNRHSSGGTADHAKERHSEEISDEDLETDDTDHERKLNVSGLLADSQHCDFFFGDGEFDQIMTVDYDLQAMNMEDLMEEWSLPNEAFQLRHEIQSHSPPDQLCISSSTFSPSSLPIPISTTSNHSQRNTVMKSSVCSSSDSVLLSSSINPDPVPTWEYTPIIHDMLYHYVNQGDVQMAISVLLVLGNRFKGAIDEITLDQWYSSYLELLSRFQLWTVANEVIKLCPLPHINTLNYRSTLFYSSCNQCMRPLQRSGFLCDRCKASPTICSVCHRTVRGMYVWCQGCCHGGHLLHMKDWFAKSQWCPTGCGHKCEYT